LLSWGQVLALFPATILALQHSIVQEKSRRGGDAIAQCQLIGHLEGLSQSQDNLAGQFLVRLNKIKFKYYSIRMCTHCALDQENMAVVQVLLLGYIGKVPKILRVLAGAVDVLNLVLANSALKIMP